VLASVNLAELLLNLVNLVEHRLWARGNGEMWRVVRSGCRSLVGIMRVLGHVTCGGHAVRVVYGWDLCKTVCSLLHGDLGHRLLLINELNFCAFVF